MELRTRRLAYIHWQADTGSGPGKPDAGPLNLTGRRRWDNY